MLIYEQNVLCCQLAACLNVSQKCLPSLFLFLLVLNFLCLGSRVNRLKNAVDTVASLYIQLQDIPCVGCMGTVILYHITTNISCLCSDASVSHIQISRLTLYGLWGSGAYRHMIVCIDQFVQLRTITYILIYTY